MIKKLHKNLYLNPVVHLDFHTAVMTLFFVGALIETLLFNFVIIYLLRLIPFFKRNDIVSYPIQCSFRIRPLFEYRICYRNLFFRHNFKYKLHPIH